MGPTQSPRWGLHCGLPSSDAGVPAGRPFLFRESSPTTATKADPAPKECDRWTTEWMALYGKYSRTVEESKLDSLPYRTVP